MCVTPITIKNPLFNREQYTYQQGFIKPTSPRVRMREEFIKVPCGNCIECKKSRYTSYLQRAQMESLTSYVFMLTLTYDDDHLPSFSFTSDDRTVNVYYADIDHFQKMIKRIRKSPYFNNRDLRYIVTTEYGSEKARPHLHALIFVAKLPNDYKLYPKRLEIDLFHLFKDEWKVNKGSTRSPKYESLFRYAEKIKNGKVYRNFDFHLVSADSSNLLTNDIESVASATKYTLSYMLKPNEFESLITRYLDNTNLPPDLDRRIRRKLSTRCIFSKHLGWGFDKFGFKVKPSVSYTRTNITWLVFWDNLKKIQDLSFNGSLLKLGVSKSSYESYVNRLRRSLSVESFRYLVESTPNVSAIVYKFERKLFNSVITSITNELQGYHISILPLAEYDDSFKESATYKYLRRVLDHARYTNCTFIPFMYQSDGLTTYTPLCKYFRRYVCTEDDITCWLDRIGVDSIEDIELVRENMSSLYRVAGYNRGMHTYHQQQAEINPFRGKTAKNLEILKVINIFAPTAKDLAKL